MSATESTTADSDITAGLGWLETRYSTTVYHRGGERKFHLSRDCRALAVVDDAAIREYDAATAASIMDPCQQPDCYGTAPVQELDDSPCPVCGASVTALPNHLRHHCDGGSA